MPELPDVENFRNYMDSTSLHQVIDDVCVDVPEILDGLTAPQLQAQLKDALELSRLTLQERLRGVRSAIKSALMSQKRIAGIGNSYSDEILYQARVHPKRKVSDLSEGQLSELHRAMRRVLETTIACQADPERLPRSYLIPHRGRDGRCPRCGGDLNKIEISGRAAYYCPHCQA